MRYRRQVALILALGIMWGLVYYVRVARAQAWSDTCAHPRDLCVAGAQSTRLTCYSNCDSQYGSGTQADITCRNSCDATYSSYVAANCTTPYNNCMSLRSGTCSGTLCPSYCSGTTGVVSCSYSDPAMDCQFSCGCPLSSKPPCSGAVCTGTLWSCNSPILLDPSGEGFSLTNVENGVWFDLAAQGGLQKWSWTASNSTNGFLVLDRNGNGIIDDGTELFGSVTPQPPSEFPNGFLALAVFDKPENGGNDDGFIDANDEIYSKLRVWVDKNHDGVSQPDELYSLSALSIARIDLQSEVKPRTDEYGNLFYLRARVWDGKGHRGGRWAWDVYLRDADLARKAAK